MPRNVRNFWIEARVDGRDSSLGFGPARKDGGFELVIKQREKGSIVEALNIIGREHNGALILKVFRGDSPSESEEMRFETQR